MHSLCSLSSAGYLIIVAVVVVVVATSNDYNGHILVKENFLALQLHTALGQKLCMLPSTIEVTLVQVVTRQGEKWGQGLVFAVGDCAQLLICESFLAW